MSEKYEEFYNLAKEIIALLEDTASHSPNEFHPILNRMSKLLGPCKENIPGDLKRGLGVAYGSALSEIDIPSKASYTRTALSLLRAAVRIAKGSKDQITQIDMYINKIDGEIANCESIAATESDPPMDKLWKYSNQAIDFMTFLIFTHGYGEIKGDGFRFEKKASGDK